MNLHHEDKSRVLARTPKDVRALMQEEGAILAGGYIRAIIAGEKPNDIDLFGPTKADLQGWSWALAQCRGGRLHQTDNADTVLSPGRTPVQFIHRWVYDDAPELLDEFDFTIAQAVIFWHDGKWWGLCSPRFYSDLAARRLVYTHPKRDEDVGGSLLRARKFLRAGYDIPLGSLAGIAARLAVGVDGHAFEEGEEKVRTVMHGLLQEVDPLVAIDGLEASDEQE